MAWVQCVNCKGEGQIQVKIKPGLWRWEKCLACKGKGTVPSRTL